MAPAATYVRGLLRTCEISLNRTLAQLRGVMELSLDVARKREYETFPYLQS